MFGPRWVPWPLGVLSAFKSVRVVVWVLASLRVVHAAQH